MSGADLVSSALGETNGGGPDAASPLTLTDLANGERLVARHGADLRYVHLWNRWLHWDGHTWQTDDAGHAERLAKQTVRGLLIDANAVDDDKARGRAIKGVLESERASRIRGMLELARSEPGIPVQPADLDVDPWLFNVENGTIDLRTGDLRMHDRGDLITKLAPVRFEPKAQASRWDGFLTRVLPDPALRNFLARLVGYSMTGLTVEQILLILYGAGANGKSTFIELIRAMLGDYGQQAPAETFLERREGIPNDVARLRGARFVSASEIAEGRRLNEPLVKRMTGGDTITARFMRSEFFEFTPSFTPWLATNHRPEVRGTDEAIWRRIRLIPFTETIPPDERDHDLGAKLRHELPGILNWAIAGCLAWQSHGLDVPDAVTAATTEYREEMDAIGGFLADHCVIAPGTRAKASELHHLYAYWAKTNGAEEFTPQAFGRRLAARGLTQSRTGNARWWKGVGIRDDSRE